jgi:hypothetical protein
MQRIDACLLFVRPKLNNLGKHFSQFEDFNSESRAFFGDLCPPFEDALEKSIHLRQSNGPNFAAEFNFQHLQRKTSTRGSSISFATLI